MKKKVLGKKQSRNDVHSTTEESFYTKRPSSISPGSWSGAGHVDTLIDFLAANVAKLETRNEFLEEFEKMTCDVIMKCADPDLHRIFKEQGWIGTQYQLSYDPPFIDAQSCLNALSNYYLKVNAQPAIHDISAESNIESQNLDQILPFCPDILVNYLKKQPITSSTKEPRRLTFKGACMLADISGFSKFSGAMCSKGVSGLDDLREATNGFLGYFVKQVYEYEGDVIAFAGDALICAFRNTSEGISESCFRALQCAHVLRQHKTAYLSTHIGVTCGEMQIALLGGHNDQWCYVMNGDCVSQLASCIEDAGSQEVAITAEVYEYAKIRDSARSLPVAYKHQLVVHSQRKPTGNYLLTNIAVKRNTTAMPPSPFDNPNQVQEHPDEHAHHGFSNMWGALRGQQTHHSHVHEVASDVLLKTRSDFMIKDESKRTGLASLGISEMLFGTIRSASQQQLLTTTTESNSAEQAASPMAVNEMAGMNGKKVVLRVDTMQTTSPTHTNSILTPTTPVPNSASAGTPGSVGTVTSASGRIVRKGSMQMESYKNKSFSNSKKLHSQKEFARTAPNIKSRPLPLTPTFKNIPSALDMLEIKNEIPYNPRSPVRSATYKRNDGLNVETFDMNLPIYDEPVERGLSTGEKGLNVRFEPTNNNNTSYFNNDSMYSLLGSVVSSNNSSCADMNAVSGSISNSNSGYNLPPNGVNTPIQSNGELSVKAKIAMYENACSPNNASSVSMQSVYAATPPAGRRFSRGNGVLNVGATTVTPVVTTNNTNSGSTKEINNNNLNGEASESHNDVSDNTQPDSLNTPPMSPLTPLPPTPLGTQGAEHTPTKHLPAHTPPPALTPPPSMRTHSNNTSYSSMTNSEIDLRILLSPSNSDLQDSEKKGAPNHTILSGPKQTTYTNPATATATAIISTLTPLTINNGTTTTTTTANPTNNNNNITNTANNSHENSSVTSTTTPFSSPRALPVIPFSRANSMESQKRRFAGWGVMKNALRRESFRDKHGVTEVSYIQSISKFVPRPVLNAVHTECLDLIGELRQVTTLFCGLNSYDNELNKDPCTLQPFFLMAQTVLHEAGGFLRQFLVDDKGCVFIAMWGVPSFTYSNNCSRALYCAAKIKAGSILLGHDVSIGIATGTVFCGSVGALERRDYAGVGTDVNMAARLMGKAKSRILIDKNTYKILNRDAQQLLLAAETMHLKGMAEPCVPYQYNSSTLPSIVDIDVSTQNTVIRPVMQSALIRLLDSFMNVKTTAETSEIINKTLRVTFCFIFGMPGTGKGQAVQYYRNTARIRNIKCIHLVARSDSQGIPYGLLRELFLELVGKANFTTQHQKYTLLCTLIEDICDENDTEEDRLEALLSLQMVLGLDLEMSNSFEERRISLKSSLSENASLDPATYITEMSHTHTHPDIRRDSSSTSRKQEDYTFYNVVAHLLNNTQTVVIIENAHYVDELSWKELFLMQAGDQLDMSVLLTMEVSRIPEGAYKTELIGNSSPKHANNLLSANNRSNSSIKWDAKEGAEAEVVDSPSKFGSNDTDPEGEDVFPINYPTLASPRSLQQSQNSQLTHTMSNFSLNGSNGSTPKNGHNLGFAHQKSTGTLVSQASNLNLDSETTPTSTLTIRSYPTEFWCSILDNKTTTVMVMGELTRDEIKSEMGRSLPDLELTDNLVDLVFTITSGNAYWCKAMTQFIKDQGAQALFAAVSDRRSRQNPLKQLVLVHFEAHTPDLQVLTKHASIIGTEFDENLLRAIVPPKLKNILSVCLDKLVEKRFIQCLDPQDRTFCFPNQLIQATLYELTPPSDAAHLHLQIAQYIETTYFLELRSHYPTLGYHYRRCPDKRPLAFKYELKAADQQVAKGAYGDGLNFLKSAAKLAEKDVELEVVLEVIDRAIEDIKEQNGQITAALGHSAIKRLQSFYTGAADNRTNGIVLRYNALKKLVHTKLVQLKTEAERVIAEEKSVDRKKALLQKARQDNTGARLNWQPSYASSKRDTSGNSFGGASRSSLDSRDDVDSDHTANEGVKTECKCVIS